MSEIKDEKLKRLYHEKLELAKGEWSINQFAHMADISPSNLWKMLDGQIGKPETLKKIADARPDLDFLYNELLYAAEYIKDVPSSLRSSSKEIYYGDELSISVPILENLEGPKGKLFSNSQNSKKYLYPKSNLENSKYFFYQLNSDEMSPRFKKGDMVLFDMAKTPENHDIVLFRINKKEGIVRYFCKQNAKIMAYTTQPDCSPSYYNRGEVEILGVAVSALIYL